MYKFVEFCMFLNLNFNYLDLNLEILLAIIFPLPQKSTNCLLNVKICDKVKNPPTLRSM